MALNPLYDSEALQLHHEDLSVVVPVPVALNGLAQGLKHQFVEFLASNKLAFSPLTCPAELLARFLDFVASRSAPADLLRHLWDYYDGTVLEGNDIHVVAAALPLEEDARRLIAVYVSAKNAAGMALKRHKSALLRAQDEGRTRIHGVFGGQGNSTTYFEELRQVYSTYMSFLRNLIEPLSELLLALSQDLRVADQYPHGLNVLEWLERPASTPSRDYLTSAPVSFPLIGLLQLAYVAAFYRSLGDSPDDLSAFFGGLTGHSQGVVVAAAVATASSWSELQQAARKATTILFWIGARSQQMFKDTPSLSVEFDNPVMERHGTPSPMLSVTNMPLSQLRGVMDGINRFLPAESQMYLALENCHNSFVVSGPQRTLAALTDALRALSATVNQGRVPFSDRKPSPTLRFLPITVPFHCSILESAVPLILQDLQGIEINPISLRLPVNRTMNGDDLNSLESPNLVPELVHMVTCKPVQWQNADYLDATHIIDFGPGGTSGVGVLTQRNTVGSGTRVIVAGAIKRAGSGLGSRVEIFDRNDSSIQWGNSWPQRHGMSLVRTAHGTFIDSKLSRLLGLPPFIIGGMTPTTTHTDFVSAAMEAGYHVELAGGGYQDAQEMTTALTKLRDSVPAGRGITVNVIYVNPRAVAWQIPLIRQLRADGFPITGLTVGGGVPSVDVASDYINTLGLEHISFKPGSVDAIRQVIEIARKNPHFPVILQWTGGRGGGHHSFEDFHRPILETYHDIRQCDNITLVAGSGFGSASDIYPYITGNWSAAAGRLSAMPFDGFLFGSRIMACKEANTSAGIKAVIVATEGVKDAEWERTYKGAVGGIISVTSEMGEPIHVLATRGALFWAEMDRTVFSVEKSKRMKVIQSKRAHIITKLNQDFQKVWFGRREGPTGEACELGEMTYAEVLRRMVQLMFVERQLRWIDDSYRRLLVDFLVRTEERFMQDDATTRITPESDSMLKPYEIIDSILSSYPDARHALLCAEDVHYFLQICRRPHQKPVPFVPILDENLETWFKKDSLWQSEDLDAVVDQDPGRTFVLQGPVAVAKSLQVDESIKDVMDAIRDGTINQMLKDMYEGDRDAITQEEYFRRSISVVHEQSVIDVIDSVHLVRKNGVGSVEISSLTSSELLSLLAGRVSSWRYALFASRDFVQGRILVDNPVRRLLSSIDADFLEIAQHDDPEHATMTLLKNSRDGDRRLQIEFEKTGNLIVVRPYTYVTADGNPIPLTLKFEYRPECGYAPIREVIEDRNHRIYDFYRRLWLDCSTVGQSSESRSSPENSEYESMVRVDEASVHAFNAAIGYDKAHKHERVPMDFAIVLSWKVVSQALLQCPYQGDLLKLVHLSNRFTLTPGARPLDYGDDLQANARVDSIVIEDSGKVVQISCTLKRSGTDIMTVTSRFLFRGKFTDFTSTFSRIVEKPIKLTLSSAKEVAVLTSKPWFCWHNPDADLIGATLVFRLHTFSHYQSKDVYSSVKTTGEVLQLSDTTGELFPIASVNYRAGTSYGNPVMSYLLRSGTALDENVQLEVAAPITTNAATVVVPAANDAYSRASGDFNPIHTSSMFANFANIPAGTITHGMYVSAAVRRVVEHAANQCPERVRKYEASFVDMVVPGDVLRISLWHTGMNAGLKVVKVEARRQSDDGKVLEGEALIAQPPTTILFTGQGSQEKGMGMELYDVSPVARDIWNKADAYFDAQFGLSLLNIVRNNPKEVKVYFGGVRGRLLRQNYINMTQDVLGPDGTPERKRVFLDVDERTPYYRHRALGGLLFATQFAQPALVVMELAAFKDMESRGLVSSDSCFTGHSLGEYAALAAVTDFMPLERLLYFIFCRGMTMQAAVERDALNRSDYGMVAVDPSRVFSGFSEEALKELIATLSILTGFFVEIVNLNIRGQQYVCAGDLRALDCLQRVLDDMKALHTDSESVADTFTTLVRKHLNQYNRVLPATVVLQRGKATVPLMGIDVPFHSSLLLSRMEPFRQVLLASLERRRINPDRLVGKYIPNVTGKPFSISREYLEDAYSITKSERIRDVLEQWEVDWMPRITSERSVVVA